MTGRKLEYYSSQHAKNVDQAYRDLGRPSEVFSESPDVREVGFKKEAAHQIQNQITALTNCLKHEEALLKDKNPILGVPNHEEVERLKGEISRLQGELQDYNIGASRSRQGIH